MRYLIFTAVLMVSPNVMAQTQGFEVRVTIVNPQQVATDKDHPNVQRNETQSDDGVRLIQY